MDKFLIDACNEINVNINFYQASMFMKYKDILLDWNQKFNLTAITDDKDILLKHFVDSVSSVPFIDFNNKSVIDVGTGAGFPGIPIKIACPSVKLTLLDSLKKRIVFLEEVVSKISLADVSCFHIRAEDGAQNPIFREMFDICVSRAVADLSILSEYCIPFIKEGGFFIALKGSDYERELLDSQNAIDILGGTVFDIKTIKIPFTDIFHSIIIIKKVRQTPLKYPRKPSKISKSPIK